MKINKNIINSNCCSPVQWINFKLFKKLCLFKNYKILFCLFIKNLFKFFFEFIKFQFEKSIYLFKCFYKYLLNVYNNPKGFYQIYFYFTGGYYARLLKI